MGRQLDVTCAPWGPLGNHRTRCWAQTLPVSFLVTLHPTGYLPIVSTSTQPSRREDEGRKMEAWAHLDPLCGLRVGTMCLLHAPGAPVPNRGSPRLPTPQQGCSLSSLRPSTLLPTVRSLPALLSHS